MLTVENLTRGATLVRRGRVARGLWARMRGLIGHPPLAPGEGLLIDPCNAVHTHFMGFPIDVVYVDREHRVVGCDAQLAPWRFGHWHRRARYVIELPAGSIARSGTRVGDRLRVSEADNALADGVVGAR